MSKKSSLFSFIAILFSISLIFLSSHLNFSSAQDDNFSQELQSSQGTGLDRGGDQTVGGGDEQDISSSNPTMNGYSWSSNIGWTNMQGVASDGTVYAVTIDGTSVIGYGWSSNVGWLSFNPSDTSVCGSPATFSNGNLSGFAIYLSGRNRTDGWDGCVSLSGTATNGDSYGVKVNPSDSTKLTGMAWGSDVVGWDDFSGVTISNTSTMCPDGSTPVNGICPNMCTPGSQSCGGSICPSSGKCPAMCPDGTTAMPTSGLCPVDHNTMNFSATANCTTVGFTLTTTTNNNGFAYNVQDTTANRLVCSGTIVAGGASCTPETTNTNVSHHYIATITNGSDSVTRTADSNIPNQAQCAVGPTATISIGSFAGVVTGSGPTYACTLSWKSIVSSDGNEICKITPGDGTARYTLPKAGTSPDSTPNGNKLYTIASSTGYTLTCTNGTAQASKTASCNIENIHEF